MTQPETPDPLDSNDSSPEINNSEQTSRREFMAGAAGMMAAGSMASDNSAASDAVDVSHLFQPESYWSDRMKAPEDGKKYGWFIDTRRCIGCHGCEVSCKAENDVPLGNYIRQTFYKDVGQYPKAARMFLPMACQHCEDAPCIKACPCGALHKGGGGSVVIDYE